MKSTREKSPLKMRNLSPYNLAPFRNADRIEREL